MHRKHNHREVATRAVRPNLPPLSTCAWSFAPGVSTSLNPPMAESRADNNELLGNSGNGVGVKSCPTPFLPDPISPDFLFGRDGADKLWGDADDESELTGQYHGNDYLDGGDGKDQLVGGDGNDILVGGIGDDVRADRLSSRTPPPFAQNNIAFAKYVVDSAIKRFIHKSHSKVGGIGSDNEWRLAA